MFNTNDRVVVRARGLDRELMGRALGKVRLEDGWAMDVKVDNTPEHGQYAGRTLLLMPEELRPVEWKRSADPESFLLGTRVRVMAKGSPVRGKYGTVSRWGKDARLYVTIGSRWGKLSGWFEARDLEVLA